MQVPCFKCPLFDPFSLSQNGLGAAEVDVGRRDIVQALMIPLMIVVIDEGFYLMLWVARQEVVFQQNSVFQGLMPTLNLALGLGVIWCAPAVLHAFVFQPLSQVTRGCCQTNSNQALDGQ